MATKKDKIEDGKVRARVIYSGAYGAMDDVIELDKPEAEAAQASGDIDTSAESVAYAESLKA